MSSSTPFNEFNPNGGTPPPENDASADLAAPGIGTTMAQHQIVAGQVNPGGAKEWAENTVASVTSALAGFGAAGQVHPGQGALAGVGAAARQKQERDDQQRQQATQTQQRQQQLDLEKQRVTQEQTNADRDYQLKLGENARQQLQQTKDFYYADQHLKLAQSTNEREAGEAQERHMEFLEKQESYLDSLTSAGGAPAKIGGQASPEFDNIGEMSDYAKANKLAVNAHENGYIHRSVILPDGKYQIWDQPDNSPTWHNVKDANGKDQRVFGDATSVMAVEHSVADTRQLNARASLDYAEAKKNMAQVTDDESARGARVALDKATDADGNIDPTKIQPGQKIQIRRTMMDQWKAASSTLVQAQKSMEADPAYFDAQNNPQQMAALQDKYGVNDALELRNYTRGVMAKLDGAPYAAAATTQNAQAAAAANTPDGIAQTQAAANAQKAQEDARAEQHDADMEQLKNITTANRRGGRAGDYPNTFYNKEIAETIQAHPEWSDQEKVRYMKARLGQQGGGASQTTGAHKVGDVVTQNGVQYRVTAVDANGKPTNASPVQ